MTQTPTAGPLWMVHIIGPDEIYPAPDHATAVEWCAGLNASMPASDVLCVAVPAVWTGSPEAHAEGLLEAVRGWTSPCKTPARAEAQDEGAAGEPVAYGADHQPWCQPGDQTDRAFRLRFEDPDMREMVWTGPDAEKEALAAYNKYAPSWNVYLFSGHPRAHPSPTPAADADRVRAWDAFAAHINWELSHGYPDGEEEDGCWLVHSVNGGRNDREWTLIGRGETPLDAALAALKSEGK